MEPTKKSMWELLWDYDPNGLLVVDTNMRITLVNSALCKMFRMTQDQLIGREAVELLGDMDDFYWVWEHDEVIRGKERAYPDYDLFVRKVIFPIRDENIVACIMVDLTHEWRQKEEILRLKMETIEKVHQVVNNQMKVAQEIASLLGETTAETKVSLLKLIQMVEQEQA